MSDLDDFIQSGFDGSADTIGQDSLALDGGVTLTGVWSGVSSAVPNEDGGLQVESDASIIFKSSASLTRSALVNKYGTGKSQRFQIVHAEIGEALTTVFLKHATQFATP